MRYPPFYPLGFCYRHSEPRSDRDWVNLTYNYQKKVDNGFEDREYWGLPNAIEAVFQSLANTSPLSEAEKVNI